MRADEDPAVRRWAGRLSPSTAKTNVYHLERWLKWMAGQASKFSGMTPTQLIEHQVGVQGRDAYEILDLIQLYVNGLGGRYGYKVKAYHSLRSFYTHSRVELPKDKQYMVHSEKRKVEGLLKPDVIRRAILSSKGAHRAAFLSILMGGMDLSGWDSWNQTGLQELRAALNRDDEVHTIQMPGRKKFRNVKPYKTRIGGDALKALRAYLADRPVDGPAIFYDQRGSPMTRNGLQTYWRRRLIALGDIQLVGDDNSGNRYGKNLHELRDTFRTLWSMSGAAPHVAEAMMGHTKVDPYGYDKSADDPKFADEQYMKALPWLNILSSPTPFGQVDAGEMEKLRIQVKGLEEELYATRAGQGSEVRQLRAQVLELGKILPLIAQLRSESDEFHRQLEEIKAARASQA